MAHDPIFFLQQADACVEWFWKHGIQRTDSRHEVSRGTWLDRVYSAREWAKALVATDAANKPCIALWGPSQSGKSTLMSIYLDNADDSLGERSPLKWSEEEPVRFVVGDDHGAHVIVLNPYNHQSDASGCVTRFVLRDAVLHPNHPVELRLADETQILHALAMGYLSECDTRYNRKESVKWNTESFKALIEKHKADGVPVPDAFLALHRLANVIETLIHSQHPRYEDLAAEWNQGLRPTLMKSGGLANSLAQVESFAFAFLWDNWTSITSQYKILRDSRQNLRKHWDEKAVFCSYRAASQILDIETYSKSKENPELAEKLRGMHYVVHKQSVTIGFDEGTPLLGATDGFGFFQGLVWELIVPVKKEVIQEQSQVFHDFLAEAELLDFPGVANSYGNQIRLTDRDLTDYKYLVLTKILKRGKTASIVASAAKNLHIDGFSLLFRQGQAPAQPAQLNGGIRSWLAAMGRPWPPPVEKQAINLVLTFSGRLINHVASAGMRDGLKPAFEQLAALGHLGDPRIVNPVAINYPKFPDGAIQGRPEQIEKAVSEIIADPTFRHHFGENVESFQEMYQNGGTDYLFRTMSEQARRSRRRGMLQERLRQEIHFLHNLATEHAPAASAQGDERKRVLDAWSKALQEKLQRVQSSADDLSRFAYKLREFLSINPDELEDLPLHVISMKVNVAAFVERQFSRWRSLRSGSPMLVDLCIADEVQANRILNHLADSVNLKEIVSLMRENLGNLSKREEARHCRRFLAVKMSNSLLDRSASFAAPHRSVADGSATVRDMLENLARAEDSQSAELEASPHYISTIKPIFARLDQVKVLAGGARTPQVGDVEITHIAKMLESA